MKRSPRVRLSAAVKRLSLRLSILSLALLLLGSPALAATPVDIYQDMESGNNGNVLTATIMNASSHPSGTSWYASTGTLWVSTANHKNLPGPVIVGGVTYNGTGGTRSWVFNDNNALNFVMCSLGGSYSNATIACYYTPGVTIAFSNQFDNIYMGGILHFCVMQTRNDDGNGPYLRAHSCTSGYVTTFSPTQIKITSGKTYWVNLHYDGNAGTTSVAAFDPANGFAQVGSTVVASSVPNDPINQPLAFGRYDNHGNNPTALSQSYFDQILFDHTNAAFPLIPSAGTDTTPPSAPPTVRDGTGSDISTTSSTTQLSANWDASTDNESGISGYQYAIGTSAGGTQTVNWTSLGNVTTVTKTGLSLTVGQTYYFSVKAVNGAGLTGSATNSNGQTVVSSSSVTYFSDSFDGWTVHGGAWSSVNGESATHTLNTSTDHSENGGHSLKITDTDTTATGGAYLTENFSPTISGDIYVRFYILFPSGYGSTNSGCRRRVLRVWTGTQRGQMSFQDDEPIMEEVGAWGSVTGSAISEAVWHCIEMHIAAPSASTLLEFWVDGVKDTSTLSANFSSGSGVWNYIDFGDIVLGAGTNGTGTIYFDAMIVSNSYNGPLP